MKVTRARKRARTPIAPDVAAAVEAVSETALRRTVEKIAVPRHYHAEPLANQWVAQTIADELGRLGYATRFQGRYRNVVALSPDRRSGRVALVGAHYDSVPGTPGADDNASGVAALLECARLVAEHGSQTPICFVAFNREEDGLIGSADFVTNFLPESDLEVACAHVLEMVGYCSHEEGSQRVPTGLPVRIPTTGDFLGLLANRDSTLWADRVLDCASACVPDLEVLSLKVYLGLEWHLPVLLRSDHGPFWEARIPALMWTDTSEFRNAHYHLPTDDASTLDYAFLADVTRALVAAVLSWKEHA